MSGIRRHLSLRRWVDLDPPSEAEIDAQFRREPDQVVLGSSSATALVVPRHGAAAVKYFAVDPAARGRGLGRWLLDEVAEWAGDRAIVFGAASPGYLWPGVEVGLTSLERFLFGHGFRVTAWEVNQLVALPVQIPMGSARRARPPELALVTAFCREHYPHWEVEAAWSFETDPPRCAVWVEDDELLGFACWSVNRDGWFGPMATRPDLRGGSGRGIGSGTLAVALDALHADGHAAAEISWVGPERFYTKVAGARTHRVWRVFSRRSGSSSGGGAGTTGR